MGTGIFNHKLDEVTDVYISPYSISSTGRTVPGLKTSSNFPSIDETLERSWHFFNLESILLVYYTVPNLKQCVMDGKGYIGLISNTKCTLYFISWGKMQISICIIIALYYGGHVFYIQIAYHTSTTKLIIPAHKISQSKLLKSNSILV